MDYKGLKEDYRAEQNRKKKIPLIVTILIIIALVQFVTISVIWVECIRTKGMFNEALETQLIMQEEINSMRSGTKIIENGEGIYEGSITD